MVADIIALFLYIYWAYGINAIEAQYEAVRGDKHHALSIILSFGIFCLLGIIIPLKYEYLLLWVGVRIWFDIIYNNYKGLRWDYLGSSRTDAILRRLDQKLILVIRILVSLVCLLINLLAL